MSNENMRELTEEEIKRLCDFFLLLHEIDMRELVSDTAKEQHAKEMHPEGVIPDDCRCMHLKKPELPKIKTRKKNISLTVRFQSP